MTTKPHKWGNQDFFNMLNKLDSANTESLFQFPLEYFSDDSTITLYKVVESVMFSTKIILSSDGDGEGSYVLFNETKYTYDQFINSLAKNYKAIQLLEPLDDNESYALRKL